MQPLSFQDFLAIYDDPYWEESIVGGLAEEKYPTEFDVIQLYQGTLVELEHTPNPYIAIEIAMDHLTEDPDYYQKLKTIESRYRMNPRSYDEMSLGELKKEERRLLDAINDYRYFGEDVKKIEVLEQQLTLIRRALSSGETTLIPMSELPEMAIQEQLFVLHNEIKTLKSLERATWDEGNFEKAASYRRTSVGLEETIKSIRPLLQKIAVERLNVVATEDRLRQINLELITAEQKLLDLSGKLEGTSIETQRSALQMGEVLRHQVTDLRSAAYQQERDLLETHKKINITLNIARRDLESAGYKIQLPPTPPLTIPTTIIETASENAPPAVTLPPELSEVYTRLSSDPAIAALQNQLRNAIQELTTAVEDNEPSFIIRRIEAEIAELHAEIERRTAKRYRRR